MKKNFNSQLCLFFYDLRVFEFEVFNSGRVAHVTDSESKLEIVAASKMCFPAGSSMVWHLLLYMFSSNM